MGVGWFDSPLLASSADAAVAELTTGGLGGGVRAPFGTEGKVPLPSGELGRGGDGMGVGDEIEYTNAWTFEWGQERRNAWKGASFRARERKLFLI